MFWKVYQKDNNNINIKSETPGNFGPTKRPTTLKISDMKPWNLLFWKKLSVPVTSFRVKVTNDWRYIFVILAHQKMNEYEWIYDWTLMLLKDFREPLLSFELIYFRNSFCYRIGNSWGFRYKILGQVGPLGKILNFFCLPWDRWNFRIFWAFCLYWRFPTQNLSTTLWIMHLLQILKKLWSFIICVTILLKQTLASCSSHFVVIIMLELS